MAGNDRDDERESKEDQQKEHFVGIDPLVRTCEREESIDPVRCKMGRI